MGLTKPEHQFGAGDGDGQGDGDGDGDGIVISQTGVGALVTSRLDAVCRFVVVLSRTAN